MKKYNAKLVSLSDKIEEEVTIDINGSPIVGFSTICPYQISVGSVYPVSLGLVFLDVVEIEEVSHEKYGLERLDNSYRYSLFGKVVDGCLDVGNGIKIEDDYFDESPYLEGSFVNAVVDRISVEFLPETP